MKFKYFENIARIIFNEQNSDTNTFIPYLIEENLIEETYKKSNLFDIKIDLLKALKQSSNYYLNNYISNFSKVRNNHDANYFLSLLESFTVINNYDEKSMNILYDGYKKINENTNLEKSDLPTFYIIIPVADRPLFIQNILNSINKELNLFKFPSKKVIVNIFYDSLNENIDLNNYCFKINIWNLQDQIDFLRNHVDLENEKYTFFFRKIPKENLSDWSYKGASSTMNISRLIMYKTTSAYENSLFWFLDSDEEFSILSKNLNTFKIVENAYSIFHSYTNVFETMEIEAATGKCVGDPPFSGNQMIKTALIDKLKNSDKILNIQEYYNENLSYLDLDILPRKRYPNFYYEGYPIIPFQEKSKTNYHPIHNVLFGHHTSRPICYHPKSYYFNSNGNINRQLGFTKFIYPGNFICKREILKYPSFFSNSKIRMHGAIYGHLLSNIGKKVSECFIPVFHRRVLNPFEIFENEFRAGIKVNIKNNLIDSSSLWFKQIEGDLVLSLIMNNFEEDSFKICLDKHLRNILEIRKIITEFTSDQIENDRSLKLLIESSLLSINNLETPDQENSINLAKSISNNIKNMDKWLNIWMNLII